MISNMKLATLSTTPDRDVSLYFYGASAPALIDGKKTVVKIVSVNYAGEYEEEEGDVIEGIKVQLPVNGEHRMLNKSDFLPIVPQPIYGYLVLRSTAYYISPNGATTARKTPGGSTYNMVNLDSGEISSLSFNFGSKHGVYDYAFFNKKNPLLPHESNGMFRYKSNNYINGVRIND